MSQGLDLTHAFNSADQPESLAVSDSCPHQSHVCGRVVSGFTSPRLVLLWRSRQGVKAPLRAYVTDGRSKSHRVGSLPTVKGSTQTAPLYFICFNYHQCLKYPTHGRLMWDLSCKHESQSSNRGRPRPGNAIHPAVVSSVFSSKWTLQPTFLTVRVAYNGLLLDQNARWARSTLGGPTRSARSAGVLLCGSA